MEKSRLSTSNSINPSLLGFQNLRVYRVLGAGTEVRIYDTSDLELEV